MSAKLVPTFAIEAYWVVSAADPYGRNLGFLDRFRKDSWLNRGESSTSLIHVIFLPNGFAKKTKKDTTW
jgi:hypothetical protein